MTKNNKIDFGDFTLSEKEREDILNSPAWRGLDELYAKIDNGTATPEEVKQYEYRMEPIEESMRTPNFIAPDMSHDELDALFREKRRKRLAAEAEAANQQPD